MKYVKTLGLVVVAAAALMAFLSAGTASATVLCQEEACEKTYGPETKLNSQLVGGAAHLEGPFGTINCNKSTTEGSITNAGGSTSTVEGTLSGMTFTECNATVTVLKKGTVVAHTDGEKADNNGTSTVSGSEVTIEFVGFHCIFTTNNTDVGTIVGGEHSVTKIKAAIPRSGGRSGAFCGSTGAMTAEYGETKPGAIYVK